MKGDDAKLGVSAIEIEAAQWIAQLSDNKFSDADRAALKEWCARSPAHRKALSQLGGFWSELDVLSNLPEDYRQLKSDPRQESQFRWTPFWAWHVAMVGIVTLALGLWLAQGVNLENADAPVELYATKIGEQRPIELADRSTIHLNTNSLVEVDYSAAVRRIRLVKGEALFNVAKDESRPFSVYASSHTIRAVGTQFAVRLDQDTVQVIVSEGVVALDRSEAKTDDADSGAAVSMLERYQMARMGENVTRFIAIESLDSREVEQRLSWTKGVLDFDGAPLAEVVAEVSRYTSLQIKIMDPEIGQMLVGGRFRIGETDALFEVIRAGFGANVTIKDKEVIVTAN